jgi:hypothetical protein
MEFGIFMLLVGILFGIGACYDELKQIRLALSRQAPHSSREPPSSTAGESQSG